ncbi:RND transporter [Croceivirga lutea]|uniref:efflux RND transporter periplasmic adaptor subunit n=1 Tax=Croceivirga lutea TaxID=1775167 RepID=UPI0016396CEE|nr:efflux RND transporter periplasmic adaptor subunit [Croceivirga lutea]GGG41004.1 RND transporter [Croceivirga lutea]
MNTLFSIIKKGFAFSILTALIVACGEDKKVSPTEKDPINVKVAQTATTNTGYVQAGSGQITPINSATLSTRMMGFVERIPVKVGQKVQKGQLLLVIKNTDLQAKKAQVDAGILEATAGFNNAEKDYQRFQNLFNQNSASQKELDDITARYQMAKARLEAAQQMKNEVNAQFAYANIKAPFSGVVTNTHIDEGAMANPGMPLVSIEGPGVYEIEAKVAERVINQISVGKEANVYIKALDKTVKGEIMELSTSAQFSGGLYVAKVKLNETPKELRSGMFATVSIAVEEGIQFNSNVTVPKAALVANGQLTGIYTVGPNNTAILRWLRLGNTIGDQVEVISGLTKDETYVVSAEGKLYNGAKLSIQ